MVTVRGPRKKCLKCKYPMHRIYRVKHHKFIGIGWMCLDCNDIILD